jgi:hypothetical protein
MPVLSSAGGRLHLVFWDQRDDVSQEWGPEIDDAPILATHVPGYTGPRKLRHTLDLYAIAGTPGDPPRFGESRRLSEYPRGSRNGSKTVEQMHFNAPNLPLFAQGTKPFIGDYLDVAASPGFIPNVDGTWRFTQASDSSVYFASWSDNRDVRGPADGNWSNYTAPTFGTAPGADRQSVFDPTQLVKCTPGQAGMRKQNIYSARVTTGLVANLLGNTKPLGSVQGRLIQRTFDANAANQDVTRKSIVLHIPTAGRRTCLVPPVRAARRPADHDRGQVERLARHLRHIDRSQRLGIDHDRGRGQPHDRGTAADQSGHHQSGHSESGHPESGYPEPGHSERRGPRDHRFEPRHSESRP